MHGGRMDLVSLRSRFMTVPAVDGATEDASRGSRTPQMAGGEQ